MIARKAGTSVTVDGGAGSTVPNSPADGRGATVWGMAGSVAAVTRSLRRFQRPALECLRENLCLRDSRKVVLVPVRGQVAWAYGRTTSRYHVQSPSNNHDTTGSTGNPDGWRRTTP